MSSTALYTPAQLKEQPVDFRIGAIISDGMWYSSAKWRKYAQVTEAELNAWIDEKLASGKLIQADTGAKSYRFDLDMIKDWYQEQDIKLGVQLIESLFPPRIWAGKTETEGFLEAPLREIGIVTFTCASSVAREVTEALRGYARVREESAGSYKAYGLSAYVIKSIVAEIFEKHSAVDVGKLYSRSESKRREIVDFGEEFSVGIVKFYTTFGKSLTKKVSETISIFIPDEEDQRAQMLLWVIMAIEKFDGDAAVPFSGYLNSVLKRWPFDLPLASLGKDLSVFQRERSKAINQLKSESEDETKQTFPAQLIADRMNVSIEEFADLEEKHKAWVRSQNATTLTWGDTADERASENIAPFGEGEATESDIELANELSLAALTVGLRAGKFEEALILISQIDTSSMDEEKIGTLSVEFTNELGRVLGA